MFSVWGSFLDSVLPHPCPLQFYQQSPCLRGQLSKNVFGHLSAGLFRHCSPEGPEPGHPNLKPLVSLNERWLVVYTHSCFCFLFSFKLLVTPDLRAGPVSSRFGAASLSHSCFPCEASCDIRRECMGQCTECILSKGSECCPPSLCS